MIYPLFLGKLGMTEVLIILLIVVIFFGGRKIPELMRGMGRGVREFKDALEAKPESDRTAAPGAPAERSKAAGASDAASASAQPDDAAGKDDAASRKQ